MASAASVELAQEGLMLSPPHRQNLLNPAYNVAGFARHSQWVHALRHAGFWPGVGHLFHTGVGRSRGCRRDSDA